MSWETKYQSNFYNIDKKEISVYIQEEDYSGGITDIRTRTVEITSNYQDDKTPIIGTGAKITFINNTGNFTAFDDLLSATEKQFKMVIKWDSTVVFEGFVICDLNEQTMLDYSEITIQATNYLRRLEDSYSTSLDDIEGRTGYFVLVHDAIDAVGLGNSLYINSSLFEENMDDGPTLTFLVYLYVKNILFYTNQDEWEDIYACINKILLPCGAFMYAYGDKWVIERYGDIARTGDWVYYTFESWIIGNAIGSLKQELNKQDGDFNYVGMSQVLGYASGCQKTRLNLLDKPLETLVFNNFVTTNTIADGDPSILPAYDTWYINENTLESSTGVWYGGIAKYMYWKIQDQDRGIYYAFKLQFNTDAPTELSVSYSAKHTYVPSSSVSTYKGRFFLRLQLGDCNTYYIAEDEDGDIYLTLDRFIFEVTITSGDNISSVFKISKTIDLSDCGVGSDEGEIQAIILGILPPSYSVISSPDDYGFPLYNYMGDVIVKIEPEAIDNQLDYELNEDFIKTDEIDLHLFDLDDLNYSNGLEVGILSGVKTKNWYVDWVSDFESLVDIFAKDRYSKMYKTLKQIKARIKSDNFIKPFAILTDDNITDESSEDPVKFVVIGYAWDLVNGEYDITAEEYPDEVIEITS